VLDAEDGIAALELLTHISPDLIISYIMMPRMDGYAFRKELLKRETNQFIPFIFLTAKDQKADILKGMQYNADAYISKPFDPQVLVAKVGAILRKYARFNELIRFDALTKVFNRQTLESNLRGELNRVRRYEQKTTILMVDLDSFKSLNDTYGHDFGDSVLKRVAHRFKEKLRDIDFVGRVGGEEFIIVMPNTDKEAGLFVANRIREGVQNLSFEHPEVRVTFSGGVASAPEDAQEMERLIKKADMALYRAKENGRNRIFTA